jgi:hypothetical protein
MYYTVYTINDFAFIVGAMGCIVTINGILFTQNIKWY